MLPRFKIGPVVLLIMVAASIGFYFGKSSVKQIDRVCPEQNAKLITSAHSNNETICVYQEPWKNKGKIKRVTI